jgi:hypothetical protein
MRPKSSIQDLGAAAHSAVEEVIERATRPTGSSAGPAGNSLSDLEESLSVLEEEHRALSERRRRLHESIDLLEGLRDLRLDAAARLAKI